MVTEPDTEEGKVQQDERGQSKALNPRQRKDNSGSARDVMHATLADGHQPSTNDWKRQVEGGQRRSTEEFGAVTQSRSTVMLCNVLRCLWYVAEMLLGALEPALAYP